GNFSMQLTLSNPVDVDTVVPFTLGGTAIAGVDYSGMTPSSALFAPGQTSVNITGTLLDDGQFDVVSHTLIVTLGAPIHAALGALSQFTLNIAETDPKPTVSFPNAGQTVSESNGTFT